MTDAHDQESDQHSDAGIDPDDLPAAANAPPTTESGEVDTDAIAVEEDFRHQRDSDGNILPVWQELPGGEKHVLVRPITQGEANEWLPADGDILNLDDAGIARVLGEFYVQPSFDDLEPRHIDEHRRDASLSESNPLADFGAYGLDPLLMALANASNFDVFKGMLADNADMVSALEEIEGNTKTGN